MARIVNFPSPLCSIAEQVYFSSADRGWLGHDDASIVRLWTADPVSKIESILSDSEKEEKLALIANLLIGIHLVSAAESIAFAKHVGLPLPQLYTLASDAAGGSVLFKDLGPKIIEALDGRESGEDSLHTYTEDLKKSVNEAQRIKAPVYLGSGALNLLLAAGKGARLGELLNFYRVM